MSPAVVQGVIWRNGAMTVLPDIGGDNYTIPQSVSGDGGIVIGFSKNAGGDFRAFRYHHGVSLDLGTLGGPKA